MTTRTAEITQRIDRAPPYAVQQMGPSKLSLYGGCYMAFDDAKGWRDELWEAYAPEHWQGGACPHFIVPSIERTDTAPSWPRGLGLGMLEWTLLNVELLQTVEAMTVESLARYFAWLRLRNHVETAPPTLQSLRIGWIIPHPDRKLDRAQSWRWNAQLSVGGFQVPPYVMQEVEEAIFRSRKHRGVLRNFYEPMVRLEKEYKLFVQTLAAYDGRSPNKPLVVLQPPEEVVTTIYKETPGRWAHDSTE